MNGLVEPKVVTWINQGERSSRVENLIGASSFGGHRSSLMIDGKLESKDSNFSLQVRNLCFKSLGIVRNTPFHGGKLGEPLLALGKQLLGLRDDLLVLGTFYADKLVEFIQIFIEGR